MTTSAPPWTIRPLTERIELGPAGQAETTFTVTNNGPVDKRLVLDVVRSDNAGQVVIDVPKPQQLVPHGGSVSFLVTVTARPGTPPGECWLAARLYSADEAPEESSVLSDRVAFEIKPTTAPPKPKIWIWLIPVLVLVLVVLGVVVFLLLRDDEPPAPLPGPPGPPVHKSGQPIITDDGAFDLDELIAVGAGAPEADVELFGGGTEAERFFQAYQGIEMMRVPGPVDDPRQACLKPGVGGQAFGLSIADINVGDVFCVRTGEGRLSVAEVENKVSANDPTLTLRVTTYE